MPKRAWYLAEVDIDAYLTIAPHPELATLLADLTNGSVLAPGSAPPTRPPRSASR